MENKKTLCYAISLKVVSSMVSNGFVWHTLQGFWYRFLVDAKIWEIKREFGGDKEKIEAFIKEKYGV